MSDSKPLTAKQEAFCRYYVSEKRNGTAAAVKAGYSEDSARTAASRLLTNVNIQNRIEELMAEVVAKSTLKAERLVELIQDGIEFDFTEWFDLTPKGGLVLMCNLSELPVNVRKLIQGFKQTKFGVEVNFVSKEKMLEMGARFLGMNKDTITVTKQGELTPEELEELEILRGKQDAPATT